MASTNMVTVLSTSPTVMTKGLSSKVAMAKMTAVPAQTSTAVATDHAPNQSQLAHHNRRAINPPKSIQ